MAPLNPNNTGRLKIIYQNAQAEHTCIIRCDDVVAAVDAGVAFLALLVEVGALFHFTEITGVQFAAPASDIFLDVVGSALIGETWGSDPASEESNATALNFVGRSTAGRRVRMALFGYAQPLSEFRLTGVENTGIADAVAILNGDSTIFQAIDGLAGIWKNYANIKAFDHWVDAARNG